MIFGLGTVGVLAILVPFLTGATTEPPIALDLVALLLPVGLGLALVGLLRSARHERVHRS